MFIVFFDDFVGLVFFQMLYFNELFELISGKFLVEYDLVIEIYGELNVMQSNVVLICYVFFGYYYVVGYYSVDECKLGWWDSCIGLGKLIDICKFFVVVFNNFGGCNGFSGFVSINLVIGKVYGVDFLMVMVEDWVYSQVCLVDCFGICQWVVVVGGSFGGMQVL